MLSERAFWTSKAAAAFLVAQASSPVRAPHRRGRPCHQAKAVAESGESGHSSCVIPCTRPCRAFAVGAEPTWGRQMAGPIPRQEWSGALATAPAPGAQPGGSVPESLQNVRLLGWLLDNA